MAGQGGQSAGGNDQPGATRRNRRLAKAQAALTAADSSGEMRKLRSELEQLRHTAETDLAAAKAQASLAEADSSGQIQKLRSELEQLRHKADADVAAAKAQASLTAADSSGELQKLRSELEQLRQKAEADLAVATALMESQAAQALKAAEAAKAALTESQARSAQALAEIITRAERAESGLSAAEKAGPDRDAEMSQLRADLERRRFQMEMEHLSAKVALEEKAADALKAAEAEWQARSDEAVKRVTARAENAEASLTEARAAAQPNADRDMVLNRLRRELEHQRVKAQEEITPPSAPPPGPRPPRPRRRWRKQPRAPIWRKPR